MFSCTFVVFVATWKSDKIPIRGFTSDSYLKKSGILGVKVRFNFSLLEITFTVNVIKPNSRPQNLRFVLLVGRINLKSILNLLIPGENQGN